MSVVYQHLDASVSNKYQCFIGGDTPVCVIETDVEGPVCLMLKESYGNAFAPYMIDYYEEIIVIDIRQETASIASIIDEYGITDALIINNVQGALSLRENLQSKLTS